MADIKAVFADGQMALSFILDEPRPSSTGKMNLVFSSGGWKKVRVEGFGDIMVSLNVGTKA